MEPISDFLYASPSFLEGIARIMDFGNTLNQYNESPSGAVADEIALRMDSAVIGHIMQSAIKTFGQQLPSCPQ